MVWFVPTAQARLIRRMEGSLEDWLENLWAFQQVSHRWQCKRAHVNTLLCASKCTSDESVCEGVKSTMNASYIARWTIVFFNQTFLSLVSRSFQTRFFFRGNSSKIFVYIRWMRKTFRHKNGKLPNCIKAFASLAPSKAWNCCWFPLNTFFTYFTKKCLPKNLQICFSP